jgi:hypothetical protein
MRNFFQCLGALGLPSTAHWLDPVGPRGHGLLSAQTRFFLATPTKANVLDFPSP